MPTSSIRTWTNQKLEPYLYPDEARTISVKLAASLNLARGTVLGEKVGTNEIQTVTVTGGPTGGSFTLTFGGQTTAAIAYNATAEDVRAALEALSTIGSGNVKVTGGPGPGAVFTVEFIGALGGANQTQMTASGASLTGGSSPGVTIATSQNGAAGTPGVFKAYAKTATDGSQTARAILPYDVQTDGSGNITLSDTSGQSGGEQGETFSSIPVYVAGTFRTDELTGLDTTAAGQLGRVVQGTIASGLLRLP